MVGGGAGDGLPATRVVIGLGPWPLPGIAADAAGNLYISDTKHCRIRKVSGEIISTIPGGVDVCGSGIAVDSSMNVDVLTGDCRVVRIASGLVTTIAGDGTCSGVTDGPALATPLGYPKWIAIDASGDIFLASDIYCNLWKIAGGTITTIAGTGACAWFGDGGSALSAQINPNGIAADAVGDVYITSSLYSQCNIRVVSGNTINWFAGTGSCTWSSGYSGDGGPAKSANIDPWGIAVDGDGNVFFVDNAGCDVREISAGTITSAAPCVTQETYNPQQDPHPIGVAVWGADHLFIAEPRSCLVAAASATFLQLYRR